MFTCWWTWTPRYGHDATCSKLMLFSTRLDDFSSSLNLFKLPSVPKVMHTVLLVYHRPASLMDCCSFLLTSLNDFPVAYTAVSSAKALIKALFMYRGISLTHWGRVTLICVSKLTFIGSDNGLSPGRRQAIIWTNAGILLIGPLGTYSSEILTGVQTFSFKKVHLKMSSAKWRPFCPGLSVLITTRNDKRPSVDPCGIV